jgi:hypothetical protein
METVMELKQMLQRLEARWDRGNLLPSEIISLDRQIKELKKKILALK